MTYVAFTLCFKLRSFLRTSLDTSLQYRSAPLLTGICDAENEEKKCHEGRKKKQKSQSSLDSLSQQLTGVESADTVHSADAAAGADSNTTLIEPDVDAAEIVAQHCEPVIGLSLTTCPLSLSSSSCFALCCPRHRQTSFAVMLRRCGTHSR